MITEAERIEIKKVLGSRYTADILDVLRDREIKNAKGEAYSPSYIRSILNGNSNNIEIENTIFEFYQSKKREQTKVNRNRAKMLFK